MSVGEKSVIFLLGAGCSFDADVPMSGTMLMRIESLISKDRNWKKYLDLYYYVKHTIEYGNKIGGVLKDFNVELLLVVLHSLSEYRKALIYPFITGYSNDLIDYAGKNFDLISSLIEDIEKELPKWVTQGDYIKASYYRGFEKFQKELNHVIRIFSLNYDLCLEENVTKGLETGFASNEPWDGNRFSKMDSEEETPIYLYKLHGSIDWERKNNELRRSRQQGIKPDIIFGTDVKLQAIDPYLFYLYEFRKYAISSEIIVVIGYSFNDGHINDLIGQAMEMDVKKKVISVAPCSNQQDEHMRILSRLKINENDNMNRVVIENIKAKRFLEEILSIEYFAKYLPETELPF